jgi:hypothetical protein
MIDEFREAVCSIESTSPAFQCAHDANVIAVIVVAVVVGIVLWIVFRNLADGMKDEERS